MNWASAPEESFFASSTNCRRRRVRCSGGSSDPLVPAPWPRTHIPRRVATGYRDEFPVTGRVPPTSFYVWALLALSVIPTGADSAFSCARCSCVGPRTGGTVATLQPHNNGWDLTYLRSSPGPACRIRQVPIRRLCLSVFRSALT
jgi:hypothetical protein